MPMGKLYEVALNVEGYQSSGYADVYKNNLTIGEVHPVEVPVEAAQEEILPAEAAVHGMGSRYSVRT